MDITSIVAWVILGALAGWIASMIMGTDQQMGAVSNIVVGIIGAFIGGFLVETFTGTTTQGFNLVSLIVAIIGAVILLAIFRVINGRSVHA